MFLQPKKTKHRKIFKVKVTGIASRGTSVVFGKYGLKATEGNRITARQIEATRRVITRKIKRVGKVWIRIFPNLQVTTKPADVRMGSGKGSVEFWVAKVKPGRVLIELDGVPKDLAKEALELASAKLPIKTKFVERIEGN